MLLLSIIPFFLATVVSHPVSRSELCPVLFPNDPPSAPDVTPAPRDKPISKATARQPRIVNGDLISESLQPFLVSLAIIKPAGLFLCTGTLLSPQWVVTAAHCRVDTNTKAFVGIPRADPLNLTFNEIDTAIIHRKFDEDNWRYNKYDIAVARLKEPVVGKDAKYMHVNVNAQVPEDNSPVRAMGYGRTTDEFEPDSVFGFLRQVDIRVVNSTYCEERYKPADGEVHICAGKENCGPCLGDSGGPLIQYDYLGKPVLIGITSFGRKCGDAEDPSVFVRTSAFADWLDLAGVEYTKSEGLEDPNSVDAQVNSSPTEESRLSTAAIVGIAVGGIVILILTLTLTVTILRRKRLAKTEGVNLPAANIPRATSECTGLQPPYFYQGNVSSSGNALDPLTSNVSQPSVAVQLEVQTPPQRQQPTEDQ